MTGPQQPAQENTGHRETASGIGAPNVEPAGSRDAKVEAGPTDEERISRLALIMPRLIAARYNWRCATPWVTRVAIDLAWQEHCEASGTAFTAPERCTEVHGAFECVRRRGHGGMHRYRPCVDASALDPVSPSVGATRAVVSRDATVSRPPLSEKQGFYECTNCGHRETGEREVGCWKCGRGEMVWHLSQLTNPERLTQP